jgi:hypothetical protein
MESIDSNEASAGAATPDTGLPRGCKKIGLYINELQENWWGDFAEGGIFPFQPRLPSP